MAVTFLTNEDKIELEEQIEELRNGGNAESEVLCVTVQSNNDGYTADKTVSEIYEAYQAEKSVICHVIDWDGNFATNLVVCSSDIAFFSASVGDVVITVMLTENGVQIEFVDILTENDFPDDIGGGISVTGASVGQTIKISAVDDSGVPTAWEPADFPDSGGNVDLTGYATEQWVKDQKYLTEVPAGYAKTEDIPTKPEDIGAQPKGEYLTAVPDGYATEEYVKNKIAEAELGGEEVDLSGYAQKSELPTKVSQLQNDAGYLTQHQDLSEYAKKTEIPSVPVKSVNGKTGAVQLSASDVKARPDTWMPSAADVGALPSTTVIPTVPTKLSAFTNDSGFITGYTETDPTVPNWAKQSSKPSYTASEVGALPSTTKIPSKTSDLTNDSGFITGYTETDPTVPAWAKASSKPSYSKSEVGLGNVDNVKQYSASNPPPYPVTSVNGKTGAVTITVPTVPTKVSAFTNDAGYLTEAEMIAYVEEAILGGAW